MSSVAPTRCVSYGCSDFQIETADKTVVVGRSMEFPIPMDSNLIAVACGTPFNSIAPDGSPGVAWDSKYGYVGINAFNLRGPDEGMNTEGLSFSVLTLAESVYQTVPAGQYEKALGLLDLSSWVLGNFATVAEVRDAIKDVYVWGQSVPQMGGVPGLHVALHDASGNNLVIEFLGGKAVVQENPVGVLTNGILQDYLTGLSRYNGLNTGAAPDVQVNGVTIPSEGLGSGLIGMPGDWTSLSRFVRIALIQRSAIKPQTAAEGKKRTWEILDSVNIPKGLVIRQLGANSLNETTHWATVRDLTNRTFTYRSNNDPTPRTVYLNKLPFVQGTQYKSIQVQAKSPTVIDITRDLLV